MSPGDAVPLERPDPAADDAPVRLGTVLQRQRSVRSAALSAALRSPGRNVVPLGEILRRRGSTSGPAVARALAEQGGLAHIDLSIERPDTSLLEGMDPRGLLQHRMIPWRMADGRVICAVDSAASARKVADLLPMAKGRLGFAIADRDQIEASILRHAGPSLAENARLRCPDRFSCRALGQRLSPTPLLAALALVAAATVAAPITAFLIALCWVTLVNAATMALRTVALLTPARPAPAAKPPSEGAGILPVISIIIPLYREDATLRHLIAALSASTYPPELMDVILVLEPDDLDTPIALAQIPLPPWVRVLTAPDDTLRTKPRALNFALDFCRGTIVGIYDAEDRPEPDQLAKIAARFAQTPPEVACLQGYLDFYNARQNWLARCFAIEYSCWFRVLLGGVQRLGMPVPLGGTTVFFRRRPLEEVGAWDAHNVTEDADLGMRLARFGYRTEMVQTTTFEEANCRLRPWIRQRSRWLKGYAITWASHMRRPGQLWRDLGPMGFFGFQLLLLGGLTAYLATPLFWILWAGYFGAGSGIFAAAPAWAWAGYFASMVIGQAVMLAVVVRAVWPRSRRRLLLSVPLLLVYWPLGAVAAYRAVAEVFTRPFFWAKTHHGL